MKFSIRNVMLCGLASSFLVTACSKKDVPSVVTPPPTTTVSTTDQLLDSIFLYAKQLYLWNAMLPDTPAFKPRSFDAGSGSDSAKGYSEIFALSRYAVNPATGKSYEYKSVPNLSNASAPADTSHTKYSYIENATSIGSASSFLSNSSDFLDGKDVGYGFYAGIWDDTTVYLRYVEPGSPFYNAGYRRGDRIVSIGGTKLNFASTNSSSYGLLNNAMNASNGLSTNFIIQRRGGTTPINDTLSLTASIFTYDPVMKDTVLTANGKNIGYIAFRSFTNWPNSASTHLTSAFTKFAAANISEIIIDLRYNGGGYVETSMNFANLIVPASANGKKMYSQYYNTTMSSGNATLLTKQGYSSNGANWTSSFNSMNFIKLGSVNNLSRAFFLVSNETASAAELLINNLKPYMNINLIGTQWESGSGSSTYGKPVGFFPITIGKYNIYIPEFWSKNANDEGDYFQGMSTNNVSTDDARYDFGNIKETSLAQAIYYITNGAYNTNLSNGNIMSTSRSLESNVQRRALPQPATSSFNGMINQAQRRQ